MKLELANEYKLTTGVLGMAAATDGRRAYAACVDGSVNSIDTESGDATPLDGRHESFASNCVLSPDGRTLISSGYDGALIWHDLESGACVRRVAAHNFWSWRLAQSADGKLVASATGQYLPGGWKYEPDAEREPSVKVFDAESGELLTSLSHAPPVLSCAFHPSGDFLAAANMMGDVRVWRLSPADGRGHSAEEIANWNSPDFTSWGSIKTHHYCGGVYDLAFSPDGESLIGCGMGPMRDPMAGNGKMTWQRWDWKTGEKLDEIKEGQHGAGLMEALAWNPAGDRFVMAGRQAQGTWNAAVFSAAGGELAHGIDTKSRVTRAQFTADGDKLIIGATKGQPKRKDGEWSGKWGRVQVYAVVADDAPPAESESV